MCTVCGCGTASLTDSPTSDRHAAHGHAHVHSHDHGAHSHPHGLDHRLDHPGHTIDFGEGLAGVSVPGMSQERTITIERDIL